ncbi:MAG TPA: 23S rRNA pseudouridine(1911/1915/1917) synthase RluD [Steroidobacteraceae bacterium]|nr:23S rRNA pseudouridine(1911/1915/1917) synthase RluD [Steroidobacteraceae bacterium]
MSPKFQTHRLELPAGFAGKRLDQVLAQLLPQYSRTRIQRWIDAGAVRINGLAPRARDVVVGGESVAVEARLEDETAVAAEALPLAIVHQDASIIVIDKPPGLVVHPGAGNREHTLQNALLAHDPGLRRVPRAGLVHRIDKDTSGLLVVARTLQAQTALVAALAAHEVEREYLALCTGVMTGGGTVDEPIGRHRTQRTKMAVRRDGRRAVTHYRVEKRYRAHTLARVRLETGRTHQIRVHLAHAGYPIVGDPVYGGRRRLPAGATPGLRAALEAFRRQALHAARLSFVHPKSGKSVSFETPLPADFANLLGALERDLAGA